jgi:hypothetical protein
VADTVRHRLGKYTQPDHPARVTQEDAAQLFRKVRKIVIDTEKKVSSLLFEEGKTHACRHAHSGAHARARAHTHTHTHVYAHTNAHTYAHTNTLALVHTHTCRDTLTHSFISQTCYHKWDVRHRLAVDHCKAWLITTMF